MGDHNNDDNDGKPLFSPSAAPDLSILGNHLGLHPSSVAPSSSTSSLHSHPSPHLPKDTSASSEHPLLTSYASFRSAPFDFLKELSLHVSGTGWRSYDHFIGQDIFYKGFSERIKGLVLQSPRLLKRIEELARKRVHVELDDGILGGGAAGKDAHMRRSEIESQLRDVADEWTENMICKMESRRFIRGAYYFATQLLTRAYHQGKSNSLLLLLLLPLLLFYTPFVFFILTMPLQRHAFRFMRVPTSCLNSCNFPPPVKPRMLTRVLQAYMSPARKYFACAPSQRRPSGRSSPSSSSHVTDLMSIMSLYSSFAIVLVSLCPLSWREIT